MAATVEKISPQQARQDMDSQDALLVCAYESPEKFVQNQLEGAISLAEFVSLADSLSKERELIFY